MTLVSRSVRNSFFLCITLGLIAGCGGSSGDGSDSTVWGDYPGSTAPSIDATVSLSGAPTPSITTVSIPDDSDYAVDLTLELGATPKDIYFVITNPTDSTVVAPDVPSLSMAEARALTHQLVMEAQEKELPISGKPWISKFNENPWLYATRVPQQVDISRSMALMPPGSIAPTFDIVGDTDNLVDAENNSVPSTCRKVVTDGSRTLNIWVADVSWGGGCSKANCIDQTMVDAMADAFLQAGADNDIYDWTTNVFGAEWGAHGFGNLIPFDGNITILLFDIDNDNSTTGGVAGYFYARDNYLASSMPGSNERVMFTIDSNFFAEQEGPTWEVTDWWPAEMLGTLAHELQHMIHFYQRPVLRNAYSITWLNEMCSMAAMDLVTPKLGMDGPRGVDPAIGTAGTAPITGGDMPRANFYNYVTLTQWLNGTSGENSVYNSYAQAYSFAAFLGRNYGGANFFSNLLTVPNTVADSETTGAITEALSLSGYGAVDFEEALVRWGVASLLSDDSSTDVPAGYRYNQGGFFTSNRGGVTYSLGSINTYNYQAGSLVGPRIFDSLTPTGTPGSYPSSNVIVRLGTNLSGDVETRVTVRKGTKWTVVAR